MIKALLARLRRKRQSPASSDQIRATVEALSAYPPEALCKGSVYVLRDRRVAIAYRAEFVASVLEHAAARMAAERERKGVTLQ